MKACEQAVMQFHKYWHDLVDGQNVCIGSGIIHLPDTEPESSVMIVMAVVDTKDVHKLRDSCHDRLTNEITLLYGAPTNATKH